MNWSKGTITVLFVRSIFNEFFYACFLLLVLTDFISIVNICRSSRYSSEIYKNLLMFFCVLCYCDIEGKHTVAGKCAKCVDRIKKKLCVICGMPSDFLHDNKCINCFSYYLHLHFSQIQSLKKICMNHT